MADILWSQDFFGKGELSPLMYSRITLNAYFQGLKTAKNVICFPQGAAGKRFGTVFLNEINGAVTAADELFFEAFQYLNECTYLLVFYNDSIDIYLEGFLTATVTGTQILAAELQQIDTTVLNNIFRVTTGLYSPKDLKRTANPNVLITGFTATSLQIIGPFPVVPGWFAAAFIGLTVNLPQTSPQIHLARTYFIRTVSATDFKVYSTAQDAAADINAYEILSAGILTNISIFNTWTFANTAFSNKPVFDFVGGYDAINFTLGALTGFNITLTASAATFSTANIGGTYSDGTGVAQIISFTSTTVVRVNIITPFTFLGPTPGTNVLVTEPAWSDSRGWPRKCSSFQNRAFFANTELLTNGIWASVINEFNNFDETEGADDSAISWFPTSDTVNYINFIVPYRSLTVHTNSGIYSTPLSTETAITPSNFSLSLQDSTPADVVQPRGIDNQIIVLSGNDAHSLLWDGFNNAYTSSIISIANEQLIRNPVDEAAYIDKTRAGSRYMFIVNADGSLAIYQTLIAEDVSGFTPAVMEQSYGSAYFRAVSSNFDGRAWFIIEREIGVAQAAQTITTFTASTIGTAGALTSLFNPVIPTAIQFFGASLPASTPALELETTYWGVLQTATTFSLYASQEDAVANENSFVFSSFGAGATFEPILLTTKFFIEQLSFDSYVDCAGFYDSTAVSVIPNQDRFDGQNIMMQGDGYGFVDDVLNGDVEFVAHGNAVDVSEAQYGFPINVRIVPLPLAIPTGGSPRTSNLVETKHIRFIKFIFADIVGGTITQRGNTFPIVLKNLINSPPGFAPEPQSGTFEISSMNAWDEYAYEVFEINHTEPFGMKLTGLFYRVDI